MIVQSQTISAGNTGMTVTFNFTQTTAATIVTTWVTLKWTYLVVSNNFDGTYTNIWCHFIDYSGAFPVTNLSIDTTVGNPFSQQGGATGDCDIYVDPLFQADLQNCEAVPANGQYQGGKIIIHAYVSGFISTFSGGDVNIQAIKAESGPIYHPNSDS